MFSVIISQLDPALFGIGGFGLLVSTLAGYMLRQMSQNSRGTWSIMRQTRRDSHYKDWRIAQLEYQLAVKNGTQAGMVDPGPYKPPTAEEEAQW